MKKKFLLMSLLGLFPWLSSSCFQAVEDVEGVLENESPPTQKSTVKLTTRSTTGVIDYPVMILAYDVDGNKRDQQILTSDQDLLKMQLPAGDYRISALTGYAAYVEPASYNTADAAIAMPQAGYAEAPLFVGSADVQLSDKSASVEILMSSQCASLNLTLQGLPATVASVDIAIAHQYGTLGMDGKFGSSAVTRVPCTLSDGGLWTTGTFYVYPGADRQTVLTITITDDSQQYSYGYTVNEPLSAAVPYVLKGTYKGGERVESFDLSGSLMVESWKDPRVLNFEFGEGASSDNSIETEPELQEDEVTAIPKPMSIWNNHVVALVMNSTETEADVLLISLQEYTNVYSANATDHEKDAQRLADSYTEGDMTGWKIPSSFEIQQIKTIYKDDKMAYLNAEILRAGGSEIRLRDDKDAAVRYLCDNAAQAIGFSSGSNIGKAGKTVTYSLRLVKKIHVKVASM